MSRITSVVGVAILLGLAPVGIHAETQEPLTGQADQQQQTGEPAGLLVESLFTASVHSPHGDVVAPIDDVVLTVAGEVEGVLVDVGGWLGIARLVLVEMQDLSLEIVEGELRLVTQRTREELQNEPEFRPAANGPTRIPQLARPQPGVPPEAMPFDPQRRFVFQDADSVLASAMIGTSVHSVVEGDIGEINDVIVSMTGQMEGIVVGVGGFLGIGEKDVVIPMERLHIERTEDGQARVSVLETREELDAAEGFDTPRSGALR